MLEDVKGICQLRHKLGGCVPMSHQRELYHALYQ